MPFQDLGSLHHRCYSFPSLHPFSPSSPHLHSAPSLLSPCFLICFECTGLEELPLIFPGLAFSDPTGKCLLGFCSVYVAKEETVLRCGSLSQDHSWTIVPASVDMLLPHPWDTLPISDTTSLVGYSLWEHPELQDYDCQALKKVFPTSRLLLLTSLNQAQATEC